MTDYAATFENFEGFSQILKEQLGKKGIWVCLHIQQQQIKIMKTAVSMQSNIFAKNEKVCEIVFACSYGAQIESFKPKTLVENLVTLSL